MTIKALYPNVRPTLNLDFARTKALDPRVTFSRASTGTFVGSNGLIQTAASGAARFDHNPATGESLGLLVEEARTNQALYSEQFDNAYWGGAIFSRTPNAAVAPDGTFTADKLTPNNGVSSNNFTIARIFTGLSGSTTGSFYVKSAGHRYARISSYLLDLLSTANGQYSIYIGNGWHRIHHEFTTSSFDFGLNITALTPGQVYTGNGVDGIYIWGAQLEAGAFPTSYIPTVASAVTRAADVASITGASFSSWYRQDEGTFLGKGRQTYTTPNQFETLITVGGYPNRTWAWSIIGSINIWNVGTDGLDTGQFYTGLTPNVPFSFNVAQAQENNQSVAVADGVIKASATPSQTLYTNAASLSIGVNYDGHIARLTYYPVRLPDAQLQALTAT